MSDLVLQGPWRPTAVLTALETLATPKLDELRISVAYTTRSGCEELMPRLAQRVDAHGDRWVEIPKTVITSTDFCFTEPDALRYLRDDHGIEVRLSEIGATFHPKLYAFGRDAELQAFVGSANLTRPALTSNGEAGATISLHGDALSSFEADWVQLLDASAPLTDEALADYEEKRAARPRPHPPEVPVLGAEARPVEDLLRPYEAIVGGVVDPTAFDALWLESGSMPSSGSGHQLELPRGGHRFFDLLFDSYDGKRRPMGSALVRAIDGEPIELPLVWHGDNQMERIYLPAKDKDAYPYTAMLFTRTADAFHLSITPWESDVTLTWRAASRRIGQEYRLGKSSPRTCGFF